MSILTLNELEFLAGLRKSWSRLYWHELARLMKEDHPRDARREIGFIGPANNGRPRIRLTIGGRISE